MSLMGEHGEFPLFDQENSHMIQAIGLVLVAVLAAEDERLERAAGLAFARGFVARRNTR
jgi:hypothetical protein